MVTTRNASKAASAGEKRVSPSGSSPPADPGHSSKRSKTSGAPKASKRSGGLPPSGKDVSDTNTPDARPGASPPAAKKDPSAGAPSSPVLERGLIYFFVRGKVDVGSPESMNDVKRSYIVLRPLASPSQEKREHSAQSNRLIAVPKKRLPKSAGHERFLTFVEEPAASVRELRDNYLHGRTYTTKTRGEREDPAAEPAGEGVYAIIKGKEERQSHLAYMLTLPEELGAVQKELGLEDKGSWAVSVRNPEMPAPPQAAIPEPPKYPKEIMEEFRGLRWTALRPEHLGYKNTEILFIGERRLGSENEDAVEAELEKMEEEDEQRVEKLSETDAIFKDLELSKKEFGGLKTTW